MRIPKARALTALVTVLTLLTACDAAGQEGVAPQRWSGMVSDLRLTWDAEPGIDIETGVAVPARAFVESMLLAQYMGDLEYVYPGFTSASPETGPQPELWSRRPVLDAKLESPLVGNDHYHILSVQQSERSATVTACNYRYAVGMESDEGGYVSAGRNGVDEGRGIGVVQVGLIPPSAESSNLPPQAGPLPAPEVDVFGTWHVLGMLTVFSTNRPGFDTQWPTYEDDLESCIEKAPMPPERRAFLVEGEHPRSDFPTSPATPGWPEKD